MQRVCKTAKPGRKYKYLCPGVVEPELPVHITPPGKDSPRSGQSEAVHLSCNGLSNLKMIQRSYRNKPIAV